GNDGGGGSGGDAGTHPHPRGSHLQQHHHQRHSAHLQHVDEYSDSDDSDDSVLVLDEDDEDEYREVEMNQLLMEDNQQQPSHDIQLLSGSLSVRSPFLDSIQEEEDEGDSAFPPRAIAAARLSSSVPTLSSMFMASASSNPSVSLKSLQRLTPDLDHITNSNSLNHHQHHGRSPAQPSQPAAQGNQRHSTSPSALQPVLSERPRGPRPPMMGRPRSNSSLTRLLESDQESSNGTNNASHGHPRDHSGSQKDDTTRPNSSMSDTVQDLEVKRVMEGHPAVADLATLAPSSSRTAATASSASSTSNAGIGSGQRSSSAHSNPDTQRSMDEFFGLVKHDLEDRIQQAIQAVEQKFLDRVHRLEERNALLAAAAAQNNGQSTSEAEEGS
ncbi:hypothetical protein BGZ73_001615, partial [Actinomortierella ambigua]